MRKSPPEIVATNECVDDSIMAAEEAGEEEEDVDDEDMGTPKKKETRNGKGNQ